MNTIIPAVTLALLAWSVAAHAAQRPQARAQPARILASCHAGIVQAALLSPAQLCPRPLATTRVRRPHPSVLHT